MFSSGVFPETFKKSKVIPLYKKGILLYCLITGRFHFCQRFLKKKIFERIFHNQLYQYFNDNNLLAELRTKS